ncbi:MAG: histidine kinase dimerization/phospho-acceptor domain-containing protein, partial [Bacteroidota bacterium]
MNTLQKIVLVLSLVVVLPTAFYSVYEISSMNDDEEMILQIYENQLDAMLFSGNQYSEDITAEWRTTIDNNWNKTTSEEDTMPARILSLLQLNPNIISIHIKDTFPDSKATIFSINEQHDHQMLNARFEKLVSNNEKIINRLVDYKLQNNFQKIEPLSHGADSVQSTNLMFVTNTLDSAVYICGIELNVLDFISEALGPKLQTIAQGKFVFSVYDKKTKAVVYSTLDDLEFTENSERALIRDFWILPDYYLSIDLVGQSLDKLVRERTYTNLAMLIILNVMLFLGVWLIFRNVRRELRLAQTKSDFVSNVSHEIRTPLALISMFAETLEMGRVKSEEKKHEYYGIISKETNRLTGIVNKILSFSQLEADKKNFTFKNIELTEAIKEVLATYEFHLKSKGFECTTQFQDELVISADKEALHEVFVNLIDNAIKYSNGTKQIEVTTGKTQMEAFFKVKDFGVGISIWLVPLLYLMALSMRLTNTSRRASLSA